MFKHQLLLVPVMAIVLLAAHAETTAVWTPFNNVQILPLFATALAILLFVCSMLRRRPGPVYLVDYACFKPPASCRAPRSAFIEHTRLLNPDEQSVRYQTRLAETSGLGDETCVPPALHSFPHRPSMEASRAEARLAIFSAIDDLLAKTGLDPGGINAVVVSCSIFSPAPSLSTMIVERYGLRSGTRSFNLSSMGCGGSIVSVDLARSLLRAHPDSTALVVGAEIITPCYYSGSHRSMQVPNCFFRMGGAAVLLSNRGTHRSRAKYRLAHVVRTHGGADDEAYRCIHQQEDSDGHVGIFTTGDVLTKVGEAFRSNVTTLGPLMSLMSGQLRLLSSRFGRRFINPEWKPYVPDFRRHLEHFCVHVGGGAVISTTQRMLELEDGTWSRRGRRSTDSGTRRAAQCGTSSTTSSRRGG
ncbi:putative 3-ketoacyl-CoA synthase 6 [Iris pallida]|uniref:3-ketoacyl-CoA synthase n=1 Tax=Iris pallida TaxID=29817 RepID=A0AAX6I6B3_IRIPA|nr:putative 3-ketoacyl-CoA synthase 6 [Iris pallida]